MPMYDGKSPGNQKNDRRHEPKKGSGDFTHMPPDHMPGTTRVEEPAHVGQEIRTEGMPDRSAHFVAGGVLGGTSEGGPEYLGHSLSGSVKAVSYNDEKLPPKHRKGVI